MGKMIIIRSARFESSSSTENDQNANTVVCDIANDWGQYGWPASGQNFPYPVESAYRVGTKKAMTIPAGATGIKVLRTSVLLSFSFGNENGHIGSSYWHKAADTPSGSLGSASETIKGDTLDITSFIASGATLMGVVGASTENTENEISYETFKADGYVEFKFT